MCAQRTNDRRRRRRCCGYVYGVRTCVTIRVIGGNTSAALVREIKPTVLGEQLVRVLLKWSRYRYAL